MDRGQQQIDFGPLFCRIGTFFDSGKSSSLVIVEIPQSPGDTAAMRCTTSGSCRIAAMHVFESRR
jgi:hypothetical protein